LKKQTLDTYMHEKEKATVSGQVYVGKKCFPVISLRLFRRTVDGCNLRRI
jgi:hypothetical protein